jgi:aminoglycoside phosphotransferase (APT) family kinase protein
LSDLSNLFHPYAFAASPYATRLVGSTALTAFIPGSLSDGLPERMQLVKCYAEIAAWDPAPEGKWGDAFGVFRNSVIMQGIKARLALKQATSAKAKDHADRVESFGEFAWSLAKEASQTGTKALL